MSEHTRPLEQRQSDRFDQLVYALFYMKGDSDPLQGIVFDISLGGLQIRTKRRVTPGVGGMLVISRGKADPVTIHAEVKHVRIAGGDGVHAVGLQFKPRTPYERSAIVDHVHAAFKEQIEELAGER